MASEAEGRVPFAAGLVNRGVSRIFLAEGRAPAPFPGPWTLRAVIRLPENDQDPSSRAAADDAVRRASRDR